VFLPEFLGNYGFPGSGLGYGALALPYGDGDYETVRRTATSWIAELTRAGQTAGVLRSDRAPEAAGFLLNHVIESTLAELVMQPIDEDLRQGVLDELAKMVCSYLVVDGIEPAFGSK